MMKSMKLIRACLALLVLASASFAILWVLDLAGSEELKAAFGKTAAVLGIISITGTALVFLNGRGRADAPKGKP